MSKRFDKERISFIRRRLEEIPPEITKLHQEASALRQEFETASIEDLLALADAWNGKEITAQVFYCDHENWRVLFKRDAWSFVYVDVSEIRKKDPEVALTIARYISEGKFAGGLLCLHPDGSAGPARSVNQLQ